MTVFRFTDASIIFAVARTAGNGIFTGAVRRSVFIFVLTTAVNVTFERRGHIVVIFGTDISVVNIGRRMHSVVFLTVSVMVPATVVVRTTGTLTALPIREPPGCGKLERVVRPGEGFRH